MTTKKLSRFLSLILLGGLLAITSGCGDSKSAGKAVNQAEVSQLEAKAVEGDSDAAMKLGEIYAADTDTRESQIVSAKWFHIAGRMGNGNAKMGLDAVTRTMTLEDQNDAELRVESFKFPAK